MTTVSVHFQDSTYHAEVSRILQNVLGRPFRQATGVEDMFGETDFVADETHDKPRLEVAARLRSDGYRDSYCCSLLLRTGRPSGRKTEMQKLLEGHGHYYFYGFRNDARNITAWLLFNLDKARAYSHFRYVLGAQPKMRKRSDSECKDLPLFNRIGEELFPGAIECSHGLFWSDPARDGRPLEPVEVLRRAPASAHWNVQEN